MSSATATSFYADAVLFDMVRVSFTFHKSYVNVTLQDGTLTDSIAAVEAAWGKVAKDIGQDPEFVIAATHGKRAVDNLTQFKPHIRAHEMDVEVQAFEESILFFADAYNKHGPGSRGNSPKQARSPVSSGEATPALSPATGSTSSTPRSSFSSSEEEDAPRRPSFITRVSTRLALLESQDNTMDGEAVVEDDDEWRSILAKQHEFEAWQIEACAIDRSVRILPGVKKLMDSLPEGRYAVATSGAKTYGTFYSSPPALQS